MWLLQNSAAVPAQKRNLQEKQFSLFENLCKCDTKGLESDLKKLNLYRCLLDISRNFLTSKRSPRTALSF